MKETISNTAQLLNSPFGGRGAKKYIAPHIDIIYLDNEISLALESSPPIGPDEGPFGSNLNAPGYFNSDPFKLNIT
jgi:hypothetical protein